MSVIFDSLVPVALLIALGYALHRTLLRDPSHWFGMEQLTYFVLFPALLLISGIRADLSKVSFAGVVGAYAITLTLFFFSLLAIRPLLAQRLAISGPAFTSLCQGVLRWNSYIALAVGDGLFGAEGVAVMAVALVCLIPMVNVMVVWVLARYASAKPPGMGEVLRQLARNPLIWSCGLGMGINAAGIHLPAVVLEFTDMLGRASLAVGLLVVGAGLTLRNLARPQLMTWLAVVLNLLMKPACTLAIGYALGLRGLELTAIALLAAVPSSPSGYVLARQMGGDAPLLAEILTIQILVSAVTLPLVAMVATAVGS
ncbi:AEC family transporter [Aquabacter sp. CN5-332]|uniref:AEC family transporter n=1 Tax=Aquabacter sp. CN5-332 TaxID=3156608 RepID=UPI0032B4874C